MLPSDAPSSSHGQADGSTELADQHQPQPDEHTSLLNHASWPASSTFEPLSSALTQPPAPTHAAGLTVAAFTEQLQNSERTPLVMGIPASAGDVPMLPMPGVAALRAMQPVPKPSDTKVTVIHYPGRLDVIIPPPGFKGWPLIYLCLSIAGNIFCAVYVLGPIFVAINRSDIAQLATLFFSVPLTCLAIFHLRRAIEGCYEQQRLVLRADKYRLGPEVTLHRNRPDFMDSQAVNKKVVEGCTASLVGAAMSGYMQRNSDNDEVRWVHFLHLIEGDNQRMFGRGLQAGELQWIVYEINTFLDTTRRMGAPVPIMLQPMASAASFATSLNAPPAQ